MTLSKFLEAYKELEQEVRAVNPTWSVYDYELSITDSYRLEKMKICRLTRNYVQHNPDGMKFVDVTDAMINFLKRETAMLHNSRDLVKQHIYKAPFIEPKVSIKDAMDVAIKTKVPEIIPVVDGGLIQGYITPTQILVAYKKSPRITGKVLEYTKALPLSKLDVDYAKPTDPYIDYVTKNTVIVTSDGTKDGLYVGFLKL